MRLHCLVLSLVVLLPACASSSGRSSGAAPRLELRPCRTLRLPESVRCGSLDVFENREARSGRAISLHIVVLPARGSVRAPDPIFVLVGGPGQSATSLADIIAQERTQLRSSRDIVLVDQRGTGGSGALGCALYGDRTDPQPYLRDQLPAAAIATCRDSLARLADLTRYTTPIAVDDLDEVRDALGYDRINLIGTSYGTRAALVYLRRHPQRVRSIVLEGVAPPWFRLPLSYAKDAERALNLLAADCAADELCAEAFPNFRRELDAVLAGLARAPARVELARAGGRVTVEVERDVFAERLRLMLYSTRLSRYVPYLIHRAYGKDLAPFTELALELSRAIFDQLDVGMHLAVTCSEDVARIDPAAVRRETEGTFLGDYRVRMQMRACEGWPRAELPADYAVPPSSDVPVLLISGALDPATPPRWGDEVAAGLPNARHITIPKGSHTGGDVCLDGLVRQFVEAGSAAGIDATCVREIRRPTWIRTMRD